jgi:superfamily II helicase
VPKELTKICQKCKKDKPLSEYYHNSTKKDYHNGICAKCQLEVNNRALSLLA